jgi:hypothetical protein
MLAAVPWRSCIRRPTAWPGSYPSSTCASTSPTGTSFSWSNSGNRGAGTRRGGATGPSQDVACRSVKSQLAGLIVWLCRLTSLGIWLRWLPVWLPEILLGLLTGSSQK